MKTWAVINQKGGSGKTTIALHLATHAQSIGIRTAVIDADPQQSAERWAVLRDDDEPRVVSAIVPDLAKVLPSLNVELAIIDTSPRANRDLLDVAAKVDLIIMPVRPSILDIPALADTLKIIEGKRAVIVLNAVATRTGEGDEAAAILAGTGAVLAERLGERVEFRRALTGGLGITEYAPKSKAALEMTALFNALWSRTDDR